MAEPEGECVDDHANEGEEVDSDSGGLVRVSLVQDDATDHGPAHPTDDDDQPDSPRVLSDSLELKSCNPGVSHAFPLLNLAGNPVSQFGASKSIPRLSETYIWEILLTLYFTHQQYSLSQSQHIPPPYHHSYY